MSSPPPAKVYRTHPELLAQLKARNLAISDDAVALELLSRYGYYRLSGYYYPLRNPNPPGIPGRQDSFMEGASLELIVQLADFDRKMRLLAKEAIERVEVSLRASICERLGKLNSTAHLQPHLLSTSFSDRYRQRNTGRLTSNHDEWTRRFTERWQNSREEFVNHHNVKYGGNAPIWVAKEVWEFGLLSRLFEGMQRRNRDAVAAEFAPVAGPVMVNWLRCFNFIRNASAHHSRLWNRTLPDVIMLPPVAACPDLKPVLRVSR